MGEPPKALRLQVRLPDPRQAIAAQQLGQHPRIHLVGLDLGFGNATFLPRGGKLPSRQETEGQRGPRPPLGDASSV